MLVKHFTRGAFLLMLLFTLAAHGISYADGYSTPVANPDSYTAVTGLELQVSAAQGVLANDTNADGNPLWVESYIQPTDGMVTLNSDGSFSYTSYYGFTGTDSFSYTATDGYADSAPATVTITVNYSTPVANADSYLIVPNGLLNVLTSAGVLANDTNADGLPLSATLVTSVSNGTLIFNSDGSFLYSPDNGYAGTDSFSYTATDGYGNTSAPATVTITVGYSTPVANPDSYTAFSGQPLQVSEPGVLANDTNADGDPLLAFINTLPANGTLTFDSTRDGGFTYTPNAGFYGTDTFSYVAADEFCCNVDNVTSSADNYVSAPATVTFTVYSVPVANADSYRVAPGYTRQVPAAQGVLANDTNADGNPLIATLATQPANGIVTLNSDGSFSYTPAAGFEGGDSFTYTASDGYATSTPATVYIEVGYSIPVANPDSYSVQDGATLTVSAANGVLANDSNADGLPFTAQLVPSIVDYSSWHMGFFAEPTSNGGSLTLNGDGSFSYTQNDGVIGTDSFIYQASDAYGNVSYQATVTIQVTPSTPVANNDAYAAIQGQTLTVGNPATQAYVVTVGGANADEGPLSALYSMPNVTCANFGTVGPWDITPAWVDANIRNFLVGGYFGQVNVFLAVNLPLSPYMVAYMRALGITVYDSSDADALVTDVTQFIENGVLANDTNADGLPLSAILVQNVTHGGLTLNADGTFSYTPAAGFSGTDSFTYEATDGQGDTSTPATVSITVSSVPVAANDSYSVQSGSTLTVNAVNGVLANDSNADGNPLSAALVTGVSNGTLTLNADGSFSYTSNAGYAGSDSFTYTASDSDATSAPATVSITVTGSTPVANPDSYSAIQGETLTVFGPIPAVYAALVSDNFDDMETLTTALNAIPNYSGYGYYLNALQDNYLDDSIRYWGCNAIIAWQQPIAPAVAAYANALGFAVFSSDDLATLVADVQTLMSTGNGVLANDTNADGLPLTAQVVTTTQQGKLTLAPDGGFTYMPDADFYGADTFTYEAMDGYGNTSAPATVTLTVNSVPVANPDSYSTLPGQPLEVTAANGVLANDSNADGNPLSATLVTNVSNGTLTLNADGSFSYTPNAGFTGTDSFSYSASDSYAMSAPATVTITVGYSIPVANPDSYSTVQGEPLEITATNGVLANDTNADGIPITTVTLCTPPTDGVVTLNNDGSFQYVPNDGFSGTDTFGYTISDGQATSAPATVSITVYSVPVAVADSYSVLAGHTLTENTAGGVQANDTNADGNALTSVLVANVSHGTLTLDGDGSFSYTPVAGFSGTDSFTYYDANGPAQSASETVTLTILGVPTANPDSYSTAENTTLTVNTANGVLVNDTVGNALAPILSAQLVTPPAQGTLIFHSDGSFGYVPPTYFVGTATFSYSALNAAGPSAPATVTITVTGTNLPPVARAGTLTVPENTPTTGFLSALNPDGPIVFSIDQQGTLGAAVVTNAATGAYHYTPTAGALGSDSFVFRVASAANPALFSTATVSVTIVAPAVVTVTATPPSPQVAGTPITVTAYVQGGGLTAGNVQYQFVALYRLATGSWAPQILLQDWSTTPSCTWTPGTYRNYYVQANVRPLGGTTAMANGYIPYTILPNNLTGVTLSVTPPAPQATGTQLTLTAAAQGGIAAGSVEYQFVAQYRNADGSWAPNILISDWNTDPHCTWIPTVAQELLPERLRPSGWGYRALRRGYLPVLPGAGGQPDRGDAGRQSTGAAAHRHADHADRHRAGRDCRRDGRVSILRPVQTGGRFLVTAYPGRRLEHQLPVHLDPDLRRELLPHRLGARGGQYGDGGYRLYPLRHPAG